MGCCTGAWRSCGGGGGLSATGPNCWRAESRAGTETPRNPAGSSRGGSRRRRQSWEPGTESGAEGSPGAILGTQGTQAQRSRRSPGPQPRQVIHQVPLLLDLLRPRQGASRRALGAAPPLTRRRAGEGCAELAVKPLPEAQSQPEVARLPAHGGLAPLISRPPTLDSAPSRSRPCPPTYIRDHAHQRHRPSRPRLSDTPPLKDHAHRQRPISRFHAHQTTPLV